MKSPKHTLCLFFYKAVISKRIYTISLIHKQIPSICLNLKTVLNVVLKTILKYQTNESIDFSHVYVIHRKEFFKVVYNYPDSPTCFSVAYCEVNTQKHFTLTLQDLQCE